PRRAAPKKGRTPAQSKEIHVKRYQTKIFFLRGRPDMVRFNRNIAAALGLTCLALLHTPCARSDGRNDAKAADAAVAQELAKLKGSWRAIRGEMEGQPRQESFLLTLGDAIWTKQGKTKTEKGLFHLNASSDPKQIDIFK